MPAPSARSRGARPAPAGDPLPKVDSVLIDQDRRLAIIDGSVVAIGDQVGVRTVTQIDRDGVVLREPSGMAVRIPLRPRIAR